MSPAPSTTDLCSTDDHVWWPRASPVWQDDRVPGRRLIDYLEPKIHSTLKQRAWKTIIVAGLYKRDDNNLVSLSENRSRRFNWQRPTVEIIDEETIKLNCFPTINYVLHYASLVSTYFSSKEFAGLGNPPNVEVVVPNRDAAADLFLHTNLADMGHTDIVIIGYLDTFPPDWEMRQQPTHFEAMPLQEGKMFSWHKQKTRQGHTVAYLGCAAALWGDSIAYLVQELNSICSMSCVLYVGRVGCLDPELKPNETLATGNLYHVEGEVVHRENVLAKVASVNSSQVQSGSLITVASPLCEDQDWLQRWMREYRWVDCETGYIAQAAERGNIDFGYLHIVSDNLRCQYAANLANEDELSVRRDRTFLREIIDETLAKFLDGYKHETSGLGHMPSIDSKE